LTVAVDDWALPTSVTGIAWFAPPSESKYIVTVEVTGTLVAVITTGTGELELMVASGKLKGLALMVMPPMLVTLMTGRGVVGRFSALGAEVMPKEVGLEKLNRVKVGVAPFPVQPRFEGFDQHGFLSRAE